MSTRRITIIVLLCCVALLIAWDFYAAFVGEHATISEVCLAFFYAHPAAAVAIGVILGHLTWPMKSSTRSGALTAALVASAAVALLLVDRLVQPPPILPLVPLGLGIVLGHFLWPQSASAEAGVQTQAGGNLPPTPAPDVKTPQTPPTAPEPNKTPLPPPAVRM